jgi:hypothetical protein
MVLSFENPESRKKIYLIISVVISVILVFYLGILYGQREDYVNNLQPEINSKLASGYQENILTKIKIREIVIFPDSKESISVGKFYYSVSDEKTDMLFKIESSPIKVINSETKKNKEIPLELSVDIASRTPDGLDFEYINIGKIKLAANNKKQLQGDFSAVADFSLDNKNIKNSQRIVLRPLKPEEENIYFDKNPNLPLKVRGEDGKVSPKPAPYYFVEI